MLSTLTKKPNLSKKDFLIICSISLVLILSTSAGYYWTYSYYSMHFLVTSLFTNFAVLYVFSHMLSKAKEIRQTENLSKKMQSIAQIGGWELDLKTMTPLWTEGTYNIHAVPAGTKVDIEKAINFYAPHERDRINKFVQDCIQNKKMYDDEFEFIDAEGKHKWVRAIGEPVLNNKGEVEKLLGVFQDITHKKLATKEIDDLNQYFEHALEGADVGIWDWYLTDNSVKYDRRWSEMLGYKLEEIEMNLNTWSNNVHPEDLDPAMAVVNQYIQGEIKHYENIIRMKHKEGHWLHILARGSFSEWDKEGKPTRFTGTHVDISDYQKNKNLLAETSERLNLALEGAHLGTWDWNLVEDSVAFDKRWAEMLGYSIDEITHDLKTWESKVHPDDLTSCYDDIKKYMDGKTESYENVHRMKHKDGHWVYILDRGRFAEWDKNGNPIRFTGTHLDMTEFYKNKELLSKTSERLDLALSAAKFAVWDLNLESEELIFDERMSTIYGFTEIPSNNSYHIWIESIHPEDKENFLSSIQIAMTETKTLDTEFRITVPSTNETRHLRAIANVHDNKENSPARIVGIVWDITQQVELGEKLKAQSRVAQHHAKLASIGELAAGVGHEINNPLAIIKGFAAVLKIELEKAGSSSDKAFEIIRKINIASDRIANIVSGLRTFSRSDNDALIDFDFYDSMEESISLIKEIYEKDGIQLIYKADDSPSHHIFGNRGKLQQVVMNLIANAKDATEGQNERIIEITTYTTDKQAHVKVKDNGQGIDPSIQNKVFDAFFTTKDVNQGTGIGLALAHNIVLDHDGSINFTCEGRGTEFHITLPLKETSPLKIVGNQSKETSLDMDMKHHSVLLVEDEEDIRDYLQMLLSEHGLNVSVASDGENALGLIRENNFDLIVSDIKMPNMDGYQLLKSIRANKNIQQPKFIFITGGINFDLDKAKEKAQYPFDGYLLKPFEKETIIQKIHQVLIKGKKRITA